MKAKKKRKTAKERWKEERLVGCKCPTKACKNNKCPIHGLDYC